MGVIDVEEFVDVEEFEESNSVEVEEVNNFNILPVGEELYTTESNLSRRISSRSCYIPRSSTFGPILEFYERGKETIWGSTSSSCGSSWLM